MLFRSNRLVVRLVAASGAERSELERVVRARFEDYLTRNHLCGAVEIRVELVDQLQRERTGHKLRQISSKVPRPSGLIPA